MTTAAARRRKLWTPADEAAALAWFDAMLAETVHTSITHVLPSEWAASKRVLPEGLTSMPGPFRWDVTPYWREVLDCLAPSSPVREVYIRKGAQVGYTVAILENMIGYVIDCEPGPTLYLTGDKGLAEANMNLRIDRMIQSAGIQGKIFRQVQKKGGRGTGDTKDIKEFPGGFLKAIGPNSGAKLRNDAIRYLLGDEADAMAQEVGGSTKEAVTAQEGDPWNLAVRRTDSFEAIRKILCGSTPLIKQTSRISALHDEGDARRYYVPCKACGEMQPLEWKQLKYKQDEAGRLIWESVHYECPYCHAEWKTSDKAYFLTRGEWRPTQEPRRPNVRSYSLSSLYSPVGMRSWEDICEEWLRAQGDPQKLRVFVNTVLGEAFEEHGDAPKPDRVMLRRQDYAPEVSYIDKETGEFHIIDPVIPKGPLILTIGADVQHDRIECELVGWGRNKESWSLGYHRLEGPTDDPGSGAWSLLRAILEKPDHGGLPLDLTLIDSGDQNTIVYSFIDSYFMGHVLSTKGASNTVGRGRIFALRDVPGYVSKRIDLDESMLKFEFYAQTRVGPVDAPPEGAALPAGYCHFPQGYDRRYFEMLFSETPRKQPTQTGIRYYWEKHGRNEALDCRIYALGALYVFAAAAMGTDDDPNSVNWGEFWDLIAQARAPR